MTLPTMPITGQPMPEGKQTYASHLIAPIVPEAFLLDQNHPINDAALSGKSEGALVICERTSNGDLVYALARGDKPTDGWDITSVASKVTPA